MSEKGIRSTHSVLDSPPYSHTFVARLFLPQPAFSSPEERGFPLLLFLQTILTVELLSSGWSPGGRGAPHNHGKGEENTSFSSVCLPASQQSPPAGISTTRRPLPDFSGETLAMVPLIPGRREGYNLSKRQGFNINTTVD